MKLNSVNSDWKLVHINDGKVSWGDEISELCSYLFYKKYDLVCDRLMYWDLNLSFCYNDDVSSIYYLDENEKILCKNNKQKFKKFLDVHLGTLQFACGKKTYDVEVTLRDILNYCQSYIKKYNVMENI